MNREDNVKDAKKVSRERSATRKPWQEPELVRREALPRVTGGFTGSFPPEQRRERERPRGGEP